MDFLNEIFSEMFIGGFASFGKTMVYYILLLIFGKRIIVLVLRFMRFLSAKRAQKSSGSGSTAKPITGSSKRECAQSAYKTAAGYWNEGKDAYSAYVWLSLAVMLGIKDDSPRVFRQTISSFDDTLRKNLSVPQIKAAVEEAKNMFSGVKIQPKAPHGRTSRKPADSKRTMQERIAHKLVNAVKSIKPKK